MIGWNSFWKLPAWSMIRERYGRGAKRLLGQRQFLGRLPVLLRAVWLAVNWGQRQMERAEREPGQGMEKGKE